MVAQSSGHRIELQVLAPTFHESILHLCHDLRQPEFVRFADELGIVELAMQLLDQVRPGQTKGVQDGSASAPSGMESILPACEQVLVKCFWWRRRRRLIDGGSGHRRIHGCSHLERGQGAPEVTSSDPNEGIDPFLIDGNGFRCGHDPHLVRNLFILQWAEPEHGATGLDGFDDLRGVVA